mmetsp:Transcript_63279/g.162816  ORF Transcript_63279/g.162816 Transcript_63279/m.162816 type:complete len:104 (+) Transcript_63279:54-365(+)|eukprot:CAMPEP_0195141674 /NCGR_PEP_ID=MMETSP0448-20130528/163371_1 /TAXON_ID=66468 /ORGANISM="Heterocapsa triquestra, Strain CCMP 448" /LENGTH=103 /DNA_ID=CAMNT_0040180061 /DNA_START=31 /DNA_END=342 /DNA_ORIENTATION=-
MAEEASGSGDAKAEGEGGEKPGRSCFEMSLDFFACLGRGAVATGSGVKWATQRSCYPVKEGVVDCVDRYNQYSQPFRKKAPVTNVPSFEYGGTGAMDPKPVGY